MVDLMGQTFTTQINYIPSATCGLRYISTLELSILIVTIRSGEIS
jgi:hypothetical protein